MVAVVHDVDDGGYPAEVMGRLHAVLDEAAGVAASSLGRGELESFAYSVLRAEQRMTALAAGTVAAVDEARLGGRKTTNAYLAQLLNTPTSQIAPKRTLGLWLAWFPTFAQAWQTGALSETHVRELKKLDNPRTRTALGRDQHLFVEWSQTLEYGDWLKALDYWLLAADPDGDLDPERERRYGLSIRKIKGGDYEITGICDPGTGKAILTAVDHEAQKLVRAHDEAEGPLPAQRKLRLIALTRLVSKGHARNDGTFPVPLVNIVVSQPVAEALLNDLERNDGVDTASELLDPFDIDGRCETIDGTPIHPRRALPALLAGRLRRQVFNAKGRTIDLGHDVRLFPPALKQALLVEARGQCQTPNCTAPFSWLVADHIQPHTGGGPTSLHNGQILCDPDNKAKGDKR